MLDVTDRYTRYFFRLLAPHFILYTEMVAEGAINFGDKQRHLGFNPLEEPLVLQIGGSDPERVARAACIAKNWGYAAINLNVGCPSDRVQSGSFGACLMKNPHQVAAVVEATRLKTKLPVTVKMRTGVDEMDSEEHLHFFTKTVAAAGCEHFIVHARKAWLKGLSPKENRTIPPLQYDKVYRLKEAFPKLKITLNGGVNTLEDIALHHNKVDGIMLGRAAYLNPYLLAQISQQYHGIDLPSREDLVKAYWPYYQDEIKKGTKGRLLTRGLVNLYKGEKGAKAWRRKLTEQGSLIF